ncbi:MAG: hypothetical protein D6770_05170 [Anaerolineae bacterium]|nr:MAG: hypothetical protein D6770_05170 [Anaerolineae bacterium]
MKKRFPAHGWLGLTLIIVFWELNWGLRGLRTHWAFFPLWLGYSLTLDALTFWRTGTSLLKRSRRKYIGLFLASAPVWWLFEAFNTRLQNWQYVGAEYFTRLEFAFWATLSFTTVIPAVFEAAELVSGLRVVQRLGHGPSLRLGRETLRNVFIAGWVMMAMMLLWPRLFFPFLWLSLFFVLEPINVWLGNRSLTQRLREGDWRPILALWLGVLLTAFFWEMWNYLSYPKWVYHLPWGDFYHVFEMPLLGYLGYLPFALELYALYHFLAGLLGDKDSDYVRL